MKTFLTPFVNDKGTIYLTLLMCIVIPFAVFQTCNKLNIAISINSRFLISSLLDLLLIAISCFITYLEKTKGIAKK